MFNSARERYEGMLRTENAIDFHDLINQAAEIIRSNGWENPFTHVLVDEFQDISSGRMALLEALRKDGLAYFLVGDDWQSIYRFAGSQVRLLHDCDQHLGHTERKALTRTFRFGEGILEPSGRFIQQNPEQTERHLTTEREGEGIIVMAARNQQEGLNQAVTEIMERNEGRRPSILVLARYRSRNQLMRTLRTEAPTQLKFSTIHAAKGRESEYVIVLDLVDGRYGFPCMTEDEPADGTGATADTRPAIPPRRGAKTLLRGLDQGRAWGIPDRRFQEPLPLRAGASEHFPGGREPRRSGAAVSRMPPRVAGAVDERRKSAMQQLSPMRTHDPKVSRLLSGLRDHPGWRGKMLQPSM